MPQKDQIPFMEIDRGSKRAYGGRVSIIFFVYHTRLNHRKILKGIRNTNLKDLGTIHVKILGDAQKYQLIVIGDIARCNMVLDFIDATVRGDTPRREQLLDILRQT